MKSSRSHEYPFAPLGELKPHWTPILGRDGSRQKVFSLLSKYLYPMDTPTALPALAGQAIGIQAPDLCAWKPGSQIILVGEACAPGKIPSREFTVTIAAGEFCHYIQVIGPRIIEKRGLGYSFSSPRPMLKIPLGISKAFGGCSLGVKYPPNPIGMGFHCYQKPTDIIGHPLPYLEHPEQRLKPEHIGLRNPEQWMHLPTPAHCGIVPSHFYPRMKRGRKGEIDPCTHYSAAPELCFAGGLSPGTVVSLTNCHPERPYQQTQLPVEPPQAWFQMDQNVQATSMTIQDVLLDMRSSSFAITWRASFPLNPGRDITNCKKLQFGIFPYEG